MKKNILRLKRPAIIAVCLAFFIGCILGALFILKPEAYEKSDIDMSYIEIPYNDNDVELELYAYKGKPKKDGLYHEYIYKINRENRTMCFTGTINTIPRERDDDMEFQIAGDCVFKANYSMDHAKFEDIDFEEFIRLFEEDNIEAYIKFENGEITEAAVKNKYEPYSYGINDEFYKEYYTENPDILEREFTLVRKEKEGIADTKGKETIEIYVKNEDSTEPVASIAIVVKDKDGNILDIMTGSEHYSTSSYFYIGEINGVKYIMEFSASFYELIDSYGDTDEYSYARECGYGYSVYRFSETGELKEIAASCFSIHDNEYIEKREENEEFRQWADRMNIYLADSYLLAGSRCGGGARYDKVCDIERYNYDTIKQFDGLPD